MTTSCDDADRTRQLGVHVIADGTTASILLHGEADVASLEFLRTALSSVELNGEASVHLQVAELHFCDASAMRQLTLFARQAKEAGRTVTMSGATPILQKMARLMNVEGDLGLL